MAHEYRPRLVRELQDNIEWLKKQPEKEQINLIGKLRSHVEDGLTLNRKYCYLIQCIEYYKIGETSDLERRLKEIKSLNPYAEIVCASKKVDEKYLHLLYAKKRENGEWFKLSIDDVIAIKGMMG